MNRILYLRKNLAFRIAIMSILPVRAAAQTAAGKNAAAEGSVFWSYIFPLIILSAAAGIAYAIYRAKNAVETVPPKNFKTLQSAGKFSGFDKKYAGSARRSENVRTNRKISELPVPDSRILRNQQRAVRFSQLPISLYKELRPAKFYDALPLSSDRDLLNAIEQANEEFEEDELKRELAVRVLAAFKTRNSAEALAQIALYDVSKNLRAAAVSALANFNHESIFETLLQACADPAHEVRAAAAHRLAHLKFDRADSWKRIAESNDEFRMREAAHAAKAAGLIEKAFERLTSEDYKIAYEAFALVVLLIKTGETEQIFAAFEKEQDENVKKALLHVLRVVKDEKTESSLSNLLKQRNLAPEIRQLARDAVKSFGRLPRETAFHG